MSTPEVPKDVQHLAAEIGRLFGLYHEQVDRLLTERTQENERLRTSGCGAGGDRACQPRQ